MPLYAMKNTVFFKRKQNCFLDAFLQGIRGNISQFLCTSTQLFALQYKKSQIFCVIFK